MHTTAVWWQVIPVGAGGAFHARWQALDGFLGAAYALHHVAALLTLSERHDLGRAVGDGEGTWFASVDQNGRGNPRSISGETVEINERQFVPTVFLYDNYPGGIGLSAPLFDLRHEIVSRTIELVQDCGCLSGCPACVGPILASDESRGYAPKQAALTVLNLISHRHVSAKPRRWRRRRHEPGPAPGPAEREQESTQPTECGRQNRHRGE